MLFNSLSASAYYFGSQVKLAATQFGHFVSSSCQSYTNLDAARSIAAKLVEIAKKVFTVIAAVFLLIANPGVFTLSFATGFIFDDHICALLDRLRERISIQPWYIAIIVGCGLLASLPVSSALLSSMWALHLGSKLSSDARRQLETTHTST